MAHQLERDRRARGPGCGLATLGEHDPNSVVLEIEERVAKSLDAGRGHAHSQQAGELTLEVCHPALQPVATMAGDDLCERFDQAGPIASDDGEDEGDLHRGRLHEGTRR